MIKPHVSAMEWYRMDKITRNDYTPRKLTYAELKEINSIKDLSVKRMIQREIYKARLQYAVENTSEKKRKQFLKKYHGSALGTKNKALIITEEARIKYSVNRYLDIWDASYKLRPHKKGKGSRGGVRDLGWFIHYGRTIGIDPDVLSRLDILSINISWAELQQLYYELPDLEIYSSKEISKHPDRLMELNETLDEVIIAFEKRLKKDNEEEYNAYQEALSESNSEDYEKYDEDEWNEEIRK